MPDALFEDAVQWHVRLREAAPDDDCRQAFAEWLQQSPLHRAAYEEAGSLWAASAAPARAVAAEQAIAPRRHRMTPRLLPSRLLPPHLLPMALAASLLLAVSAGLWLRQGGFDTLRSDYVAPTGETRSVDLADGSRIDLNSGAAVAVDLQPGRRSVRLFRGEAFFTVAHDGRPFVVQTAAGEVHVVGTAFNVSLANGQARVSVLQGVVELRSADGRTTRLVHDQSASLGSAGISSVAGFDAAQVTAWQRHQMVFYRTPLGAVIDELNRYRPGHIVILGDDIRARRVTGIFDTRQPSAALDVIARTLDIRTTRVADMLILLH